MNVYEQLMQEQSGSIADKSVNVRRMAERLDAISRIGMTADGGSCRVGYSREDRQAKELVKNWMRQAGLEVHEDAAGNLFGRLAGSQPALPSVLSGSHLDTVPNGGHFDGVLGVVAALEVAQCWQETGFMPRRSLEVVVFADEEGTRFQASLTGSRLLLGELTAESLQSYRDPAGMSFAQALAADQLDASRLETAIRKPEDMYAFIELHIEQGKVLEEQDLAVGIVNGIAGPAWLELRWLGEAGHAGGTPMRRRRDALAGAAEWMHCVEGMPSRFSATAVATIGKLEVFPGGSNVIPGEVRLIADVRDIDLKSRDELLESMVREAELIAAKRGLDVEVKPKIRIPPTLMAEKIMRQIQAAVENAGMKPFLLPSGAGHDAMVIGRHVPSGMIFVRCRGGISHSPREWVTLADIAAGCQVLKDILETLVLEEQAHDF